MNDIGLILIILLQRIMELLAFYFVLANMNGRNLKEALQGLVRDKQRILYENIVLFIGYVLVMTALIYQIGELGYLVVSLTQLFVGLALVKSWNIKQGLVGVSALLILAFFITIVDSLIVSLPHLVFFGSVLVLTIGASHQNYFYKMYGFLAKKKLWLNVICFVGFIIFYVSPFLFHTYRLPVISLVLLLFWFLNILMTKGCEKELVKTIDFISKCSYEELLLFLKELSDDGSHSELMEYFIINDKLSSPKFMDALSLKLQTYKQTGIIKGYHCYVREEQIKISIFL